jgi:hypothetical protein
MRIGRREFLLGGAAAATLSGKPRQAFIERIQPAPPGGGFAMDDFWVWCGSVIRGEDRRYHMFASRWTRALPFGPHWVTQSEIVRAVADRPEGPYRMEEVVLPARGEGFWDGQMTHNPTIHRWRDTYLLFYIGSTYRGPAPTPENPARSMTSEPAFQARANQRIGVATSKSIRGPWKRPGKPILEPRPGKWDGLMTTNPAPCVGEDGSVLLMYKSARDQKDLLRLGVARADRFDGPYKRLTEESIFNFDKTGDHVEDPYIWRSGGRYELIMKDMRGGICGEAGGGIHATSADGVAWTISDPPKAYSRKIRWADGRTTEQRLLERPQLLIENGKPTHLFAATALGSRERPFERTWNMVIPLRH